MVLSYEHSKASTGPDVVCSELVCRWVVCGRVKPLMMPLKKYAFKTHTQTHTDQHTHTHTHTPTTTHTHTHTLTHSHMVTHTHSHMQQPLTPNCDRLMSITADTACEYTPPTSPPPPNTQPTYPP